MSASIGAVLAERPKSRASVSSSSSTSDILDLRGDEGWEDVQPEEEEDLQVVGLLDDGAVFPTVRALLAEYKTKHNFELLKIRRDLGLDFYGTIRLVNYVRSYVKAGHGLPHPKDAKEFEDEKYLQPVLQDDALLFGLDEVDDVSAETAPSDDAARITELQQELSDVRSQFVEYKQTVRKTLDARLDEQASSLPPTASTTKDPNLKDDDSHYFTSYAYNDIHETMLKDTLRTTSYRNFIYAHKPLFAGKTVLDVGCGTGILSLFCARAGAARVLAVDNSTIIHKATQTVFDNGLSHVITCLHGKIEELTLPVEKVDIIISEWMGYCLLYEAMLDSVLWARDRYLDPEHGLMVPSHMTLRIAPLTDPDYVADHVDYWWSVYGFRMESMLEGIYDDVLIRDVPKETIATSKPATFLSLPLHEIKKEELVFTAPFELDLDTWAEGEEERVLDGWVIWFDTFFGPSRTCLVKADAKAEDWHGLEEGDKDGVVAFSTGPFGGSSTHWRQGCLLIDHSKTSTKTKTDAKGKREPTVVRRGERVTGEVTYRKRADNDREVDIDVSWAVLGAASASAAAKKQEDERKRKQTWFMR